MNTPTAKKTTKAQQITELEAAVNEKNAEIARLGGRIRELEETLDNRQQAEAANAKAAAEDKRALGGLLAAIKPIEEATRNWGTWPEPGLGILRKFTFGHLKGLLDAYGKAIR